PAREERKVSCRKRYHGGPGSRENGGCPFVMPHIAGSLRALVSNLIDYAGFYPPAALPLERVAEKYEAYRTSPERWMLNRVVLPAAKLAEARMDENWRVSLLLERDPGA